MSNLVERIVRPIVDHGIVATDSFEKKHYRRAALVVCNRIRADLDLPDADRLLKGYPEDTRWHNPVVMTAVAGKPLTAAWFDGQSIVVDTVNKSFEYPLTEGSAVIEFIRLFDLGEYPKLDARKRSE